MVSALQTLKEVSLADRAYGMIRTAILEGELKANERFTIEEIAARLGISRTPVREALKGLQGEGLIRLLPHKGAMVEPYVLSDVRHRYRITGMLEGYAAELACAEHAQKVAEQLEENCATVEQLIASTEVMGDEEVRRLVELNTEFHAVIREASGSKTLVRLLESLRQPSSYSMNYWKGKAGQQASMRIHRKIAEAFRKGDPDRARDLVQEHLMEACERITGAMAAAEAEALKG